MKYKLLLLSFLFVTINTGHAQDSLKVNFTPGEFLSWLLTENDFDAMIAKNENWYLEHKEYSKEDKLHFELFGNKENIFLTVGRYRKKNGDLYFYALNTADGAWILKLIADLFELQKSKSATFYYDKKRGHFVYFVGIQKIEITFGRSMFTVFVVPTA